MKISVQTSLKTQAADAMQQAYNQLLEEIGKPDLLMVYASSNHLNHLADVVGQVDDDVPVHGATTCRGLLSAQGHQTHDGDTLGLFGISDPDGSFGVGCARFENGVEQATDQALDAALAQCQRQGEVPSLIWLSSTPGNEESVLCRLQERLGDRVPVIGGSAADNNVTGEWGVFCRSGNVIQDGLILCTMFPSTEIAFAFHSGYEPSEISWEVSEAEGRDLKKLDGKPAGEMYDLASGGLVKSALQADGQLLSQSTFLPLGRIDSQIGEVPMYLLSHPAAVQADGTISLFSEVQVGDRLTLMHSSPDSLIQRPAMVVDSALNFQNWHADDVAGGLVIFCGGCMLAVEDSMDDVAQRVSQTLPQTPFLATFTFGEQGRFLHGANRHGNLMISSVLFKKSRKAA